MNNTLDARKVNLEYFDLNNPTYCTTAKKWFVSIRHDPQYYLHKDGSIQFGTFIDFVPGEHIFNGLYKNKKDATKIIKIYNRRWLLKHQPIDIDVELAKEFARLA